MIVDSSKASFFTLLVLLNFLVVGCDNSDLAQPIRTAPTWEPDSALVQELGDRADYDFGSMQLPPGFKVVETTKKDHLEVYGFLDEERRQIQVTIFKLKDNEEQTQIGFVLDKFIGGLQKRYPSEWSSTRQKRGLINGDEFVRLQWEGFQVVETGPAFNRKQMQNKKKSDGVMMLGYHGRTLYVFSLQDDTDENLLPLMETAVKTFRTKN